MGGQGDVLIFGHGQHCIRVKGDGRIFAGDSVIGWLIPGQGIDKFKESLDAYEEELLPTDDRKTP